MRLRQVALAATDLAAAVDTLTHVLGIEVGFRDPGVGVFGLENAVMPVGETFLEVVSPVRADASAARWIARRGGDAGYMAIFQCEDLAREKARATDGGAKVVWEGEHEGGRTTHFHPRGLGAIVSLDEMPGWEEWVWAGPAWRDHVGSGGATAITGVVMGASAPTALAGRWSDLLGLAVDAEGRIALPRGGRLVFEENEGDEALVGVELAVTDPAAFEARARERGVWADGAARIAGVRFRVS